LTATRPPLWESKMSSVQESIAAATQFLRERSDFQPEFGLILGTGLGGFAEEIQTELSIPFEEIPGFVKSTALSHAGNLILGELSGRRVMAMQGRVHYYEGYSMQEITLPVRVMRAMGCHSLIMSNAVGSMNPNIVPGHIGVLVDHINLMGDNPLIGPNDDELGPRFPDMSQPYDREYIERAVEVALSMKLQLHKAVYAAVAGPNLETAAEYRFLRAAGADLVGMSMVPENLAAVHGGMRVLGLSVVTDMGLADALKPAEVEKIIAIANSTEPRLSEFVTRFLQAS
ncbi:MAG TPA: purine-nucleoside phosphorylase, partial [Candidatus Krumholzibacteria bacterium]|nr:purine-nucleoside phosphorylase [Candidatus Krumholzibacteria bacterium]